MNSATDDSDPSDAGLSPWGEQALPTGHIYGVEQPILRIHFKQRNRSSSMGVKSSTPKLYVAHGKLTQHPPGYQLHGISIFQGNSNEITTKPSLLESTVRTGHVVTKKSCNAHLLHQPESSHRSKNFECSVVPIQSKDIMAPFSTRIIPNRLARPYSSQATLGSEKDDCFEEQSILMLARPRPKSSAPCHISCISCQFDRQHDDKTTPLAGSALWKPPARQAVPFKLTTGLENAQALRKAVIQPRFPQAQMIMCRANARGPLWVRAWDSTQSPASGPDRKATPGRAAPSASSASAPAARPTAAACGHSPAPQRLLRPAHSRPPSRSGSTDGLGSPGPSTARSCESSPREEAWPACERPEAPAVGWRQGLGCGPATVAGRLGYSDAGYVSPQYMPGKARQWDGDAPRGPCAGPSSPWAKAARLRRVLGPPAQRA